MNYNFPLVWRHPGPFTDYVTLLTPPLSCLSRCFLYLFTLCWCSLSHRINPLLAQSVTWFVSGSFSCETNLVPVDGYDLLIDNFRRTSVSWFLSWCKKRGLIIWKLKIVSSVWLKALYLISFVGWMLIVCWSCTGCWTANFLKEVLCECVRVASYSLFLMLWFHHS